MFESIVFLYANPDLNIWLLVISFIVVMASTAIEANTYYNTAPSAFRLLSFYGGALAFIFALTPAPILAWMIGCSHEFKEVVNASDYLEKYQLEFESEKALRIEEAIATLHQAGYVIEGPDLETKIRQLEDEGYIVRK